MTLWRISNHTDLSGEGGKRASARWHTAGVPVVYLAASPAGALLEVLAHHMSLSDLPDSFQWLEIALDGRVDIDRPSNLGTDWQSDVADTRRIGDAWLIERSTALFEVPSVLAPKTANYLLNPRHPDAHRLRVTSVVRYPLDPRFIQRVN